MLTPHFVQKSKENIVFILLSEILMYKSFPKVLYK